MTTITTEDGTEIFYKDWDSGEPVVFSHGWPVFALVPVARHQPGHYQHLEVTNDSRQRTDPHL